MRVQDNPFTVPPGLVGEIARFIHDAAPRPVPEIALAGAIGLMAGICGRSYNVSGTGLNQYVLLLAGTGTGKEGAASGISAVMKAVRANVPASTEFVGPAEIASPQALLKYMANTSPCFVSIQGEFGLKLQQLSAKNANSNEKALRRMFLDLYNKSGKSDELKPIIYSDRDKNTQTVVAPAFSILGESTPESFYVALSEGMIADGLLPRFTIIEYHGLRPPLNENRIEPQTKLIEDLSTLCSHCLNLNQQNKCTDVGISFDAREIFNKFNIECDNKINNSDKEVKRHLWNRAHIKALKLAALVAVGVNPFEPCIVPELALWAINIEEWNINNLLNRFDNDEIGEQSSSEVIQQKRVREVIEDWVKKPWQELERYKIGSEQMHRDFVVPYSYISKRLTNDAIFKNSKNGATATIKRTVEELIRFGEIARIPPMRWPGFVRQPEG